MNAKICGVKTCNRFCGEDKDISFFRFPRESERARLWAIACGLLPLYESKKAVGISLYTSMYRVCSRHFEDRCFIHVPRKNRLKITAVPTLHLDKDCALQLIEELKNSKMKDEILVSHNSPTISSIDSNSPSISPKEYTSTVPVESNSHVEDIVMNSDAVACSTQSERPVTLVEDITKHNFISVNLPNESILIKVLPSETNTESDELSTPNGNEPNQSVDTDNNSESDSDSSSSPEDVYKWVSTWYRSDSVNTERSLDFAKQTIHKQRKTISVLQRNVKQLKARNNTFKMLFRYLKDNNLVTEDGHSVISAFLKS